MKILKKSLCALLVMALLIPFGAAIASDSGSEKVTLIVQMENGSTVEQMYNAASVGTAKAGESEQRITNRILREQRSVQRDIIFNVDSDVNIGYSYTAALNGFSMEADAADIPYIKALDGVKNVYISRSHPLTDPKTDGEQTYHTDYGAIMTKIADLQEQGYRGEGMVIAVIDTEFDTGHEFLSGEVTNPRLSKSDIAEVISDQEMNAKVSANQVWKSEKIPFAYNYATESSDTYSDDYFRAHGTHVAGIAAGKNGKLPNGDAFDGTAPEAQIICMAVPMLEDYHCIAAIDDAIKLGADVLNMSWGSEYYEDGVYEEVFANAHLAGMYLTHSVGNGGMGYASNTIPASMFDYGSVGIPSDSGILTNVASADSPAYWFNGLHLFVNGMDISPVSDHNYYHPFNETVDDEIGLEYVMLGKDYEYEGDLTGKIAVLDYTLDVPIETVVGTAVRCNASAMILIVSDEEYGFVYIPSSDLQDMPTVIVLESSRHILESGNRVTAKIMDSLSFDDDMDVSVSSFSSWGVLTSLRLDPNITAIGSSVYSSMPDGQYDTMQGTSMAAPQVAGTAALMKEYLKKNETSFDEKSPAEQIREIENRMVSTAQTLHAKDFDEKIAFCSPRVQGAGLLNAVAAVTTPVVLSGTEGRTKIELGEELTNDISFTFKAENLTDSPVTYDSVTMDVFTNALYEHKTMNFSQELKTVSVSLPQSVTVPANGTENIDVSFKLDDEYVKELEEDYVNGFYVDGFVFLKSDSDVPALVIPFMGFHGDWDAGPLLDTTGYFEAGLKLGSGYDRHSMYQDYLKHIVDNCEFLGRNRLLTNYYQADDYVDYALNYDDPSFAGYSPNGDGIFDYLCVSFMPLRYVDRAYYEIKNADGDVLLTWEYYDVVFGGMPRFTPTAKAFTYEELKDAGADKEGDYTVTLTVRRYGTDEPETVVMPFYVDFTKPVIESCTLTDDGHLDIDISDNKHLMGIVVADVTNDEIAAVVPINGLESCGIAIDMAQHSHSKLKVDVYDYTDNMTSIYINPRIGDINDDGEVSNVDLVMLARYIVNLEQFSDKQIAEANFVDDNVIDNKDLVELARYLVKW